MGLAHRIDGLRGATALFAVAISACTWLWFRLHWAAGGNFYIACAMMPPMINTASLHWLARPHVFSWLFLLGALLYAERPSRRFGAMQWAAIAGATALWANLHASFFFAPMIALVYAISRLLRPLIWPLDRRDEMAKARWYLLACAAAIGGSLINPYGWRLHLHIVRYLLDGELLDRVAEFQSYNFHAAGSKLILVTIGLAAIGGTVALAQKRIAHFLLAMMFMLAALRSARALPLVALLILPLANGAITAALESARGLREPLAGWLSRALAYSNRTLLLDGRLNGVPFAVVSIVAVMLGLRVPTIAAKVGFAPDDFPVAASSVIEKLPVDARVLAPDKYGGYLIYRFNGERKVYFDGRSDFYGADFMKQYIELVEVRPGWQETLRSLHFTHALLPNRYSLTAALEQTGWRTLYKDNVATVLEAH